MAITVSTASASVANWQTAATGRLGDAVQAQLDFGDDAERALRADEQPRQVIAGGRFAHPPAGADHPPVGQRHRQAEHVLADGAVAHRVGAAGARRAHAADRGVRRRDRPERTAPGRADAAFSVRCVTPASMRQSMFGRVHLQDARHARQVEADAAAHRRDMPLQRGAGAVRHHRHAMRVAQAEQARGLLGGLDEGDGVGQHRRLGVLAVAVVLAQGGIGGQALAQEGAGGGDHGFGGCVHGVSFRRAAARGSLGDGRWRWQGIRGRKSGGGLDWTPVATLLGALLLVAGTSNLGRKWSVCCEWDGAEPAVAWVQMTCFLARGLVCYLCPRVGIRPARRAWYY